MSKLILLWLVMLLGILFLLLPYSAETNEYFPLSHQELSLQMHIWFILNKLTFVVFAWIILKESAKYKDALWVFFGIQVLKLFDYLLCYNEVWTRIGGIPVSSTSLGILLFTFAIAYELWKEN